MAYSEKAFDAELLKIRDRLAELKYIDDALAYLASPWEVEPATPGEMVQTGFAKLSYHLGTTYPFVAMSSGPYPLYMQKDANQAIPAMAQPAQVWAQGLVDDVTAAITHLKNSTSSKLEALAWSIANDTVVPLTKDIAEGDVGKLGETLGHWRGEAAGSFSANFYSPLEEVNQQQQLVGLRLAAAVATQKAILDVAQESLMNLVLAISHLIDQQLRNRQAQAAADAQESLEVAGTALSIIGTVAGLGSAGAGAAIGVVGSLVSFASGQIPSGDVRTLYITVSEATDVARQFRLRILGIVGANRSHQDDFNDRDLSVLYNDAKGALAAGDMFPPRPELSSSDHEGFHHDSSEQY